MLISYDILHFRHNLNGNSKEKKKKGLIFIQNLKYYTSSNERKMNILHRKTQTSAAVK